GAKGDGLSASATGNDTAFQACATAIGNAGGGTMYVPPGTYMRRQGTKLSSNTRVIVDAGATIKADTPNWTGSGQTNAFFSNVNYNVSALTDHDISVTGGGLFDYNSLTPGGGGAHAIDLKYVDRVNVIHIHSLPVRT